MEGAFESNRTECMQLGVGIRSSVTDFLPIRTRSLSRRPHEPSRSEGHLVSRPRCLNPPPTPPLSFGGAQTRTEIGPQLPQVLAGAASVEPIGGDSQMQGLLKIWNGPLHVVPGRSRCWLYDDVMLRSEQGQSLSLSLVPTHHESAAAVRCQSPQGHGHPPPLDSPKAAAVAGDEHYDGHPGDLSHGATRCGIQQPP